MGTNPPEIGCPESAAAVGCHLAVIVRLADGAVLRSEPQPFPLTAIRAGAKQLYWVHGISFALVRAGARDGPSPADATVPLDVALNDVRATEASGEQLLVLTSEGLFSVGPGEATPRQLASEPSAWSLAASARAAVWSTGQAGADAGSVKRLDLSSGAVTSIAEAETRPGAVAVDEDGVYWASFGTGAAGAIRMVRTGAASPSTLAAGEQAPRAIATDAASVYWLTEAPDGRHLRGISKHGGEARELAHVPAPEGSQGEERLVVTGAHAYFAVGGRLERVPVSGGASSTVVRVRAPGRIASFDADGEGLYLAVEFPGSAPATGTGPAPSERPRSR